LQQNKARFSLNNPAMASKETSSRRRQRRAKQQSPGHGRVKIITRYSARSISGVAWRGNGIPRRQRRLALGREWGEGET
jgi:hypothetical protein